MVSRKVGTAVVRNRVRRRLREAMLALLRDPAASVALPDAFDVLVITRPSAADAGYAELARGLRTALDRAVAPGGHGRPGGRPRTHAGGAA